MNIPRRHTGSTLGPCSVEIWRHPALLAVGRDVEHPDPQRTVGLVVELGALVACQGRDVPPGSERRGARVKPFARRPSRDHAAHHAITTCRRARFGDTFSTMLQRPWPLELAVRQLIRDDVAVESRLSVVGLVRLDEVLAGRMARGIKREDAESWIDLHRAWINERFGSEDLVPAFTRCSRLRADRPLSRRVARLAHPRCHAHLRVRSCDRSRH